jgi:hypothetical protein
VIVSFVAGLYASAEAERVGPPDPKNELPNDDMTATEVVLCLQLTGEPGVYILSTDIRAYTEEPGLEFGMDDMPVTIKEGGTCRIRIPCDLHRLPKGMYRVMLSLNRQLVTEFPFSIAYPSQG